MKKLLLIPALVLGLSNVALANKKAAAPAKPTTLKLNTSTSEIGWTGRKVLINDAHNGNMKLKSGEVMLTNNQITGGQFEIDMTSINNLDMEGKPKKADLEGHLKSPDFFDVQKFPTAQFKISTVKPVTGVAGATHEITGDLTLKGVTKPVTFPAQITMKDGMAEAVATLKIDRTVWGVKYASDKFFKNLGDKVIANEIDLNLKLVANQ